MRTHADCSGCELIVVLELELDVAVAKMDRPVRTEPRDPDQQLIVRSIPRTNPRHLVLIELEKPIRGSDALPRAHTLVTVYPHLESHRSKG